MALGCAGEVGVTRHPQAPARNPHALFAGSLPYPRKGGGEVSVTSPRRGGLPYSWKGEGGGGLLCASVGDGMGLDVVLHRHAPVYRGGRGVHYPAWPRLARGTVSAPKIAPVVAACPQNRFGRGASLGSNAAGYGIPWGGDCCRSISAHEHTHTHTPSQDQKRSPQQARIMRYALQLVWHRGHARSHSH